MMNDEFGEDIEIIEYNEIENIRSTTAIPRAFYGKSLVCPILFGLRHFIG